VLLQGNLKEFSLPNIFQLVKMSAKSGALTLRREGEWGKIFFRDGVICYAFSVPQHLPLGERLVRTSAITAAQLREALDDQKRGGEGARIGGILLDHGIIDRGTLERAVREQVQDAAFDFFSWPDGRFEFGADEQVTDEDILVEMNVENVIMEGCRRIDEWELIVGHLGSLERVPRLAYSERIEESGALSLTVEEWRVIVHIDGRADINTILRDCGLDRFQGAKVIYCLFSSGLVAVGEPVIEGIGKGVSVAVRGPIDIYNEVFLSTLTDANIVKQLRVEIIDDKEVEIPVIAGQIPTAREGEPGAAEDALVFTAPASAPEQVWTRLAGESSAWVLLANANDVDSLRSTKADLDFVRGLGDVPLVIATYMSMASEELTPAQVAEALGVDSSVPVIPCHLRDRKAVTGIVLSVLELLGR
jgi:hypothetical protein